MVLNWVDLSPNLWLVKVNGDRAVKNAPDPMLQLSERSRAVKNAPDPMLQLSEKSRAREKRTFLSSDSQIDLLESARGSFL